MLSPTGPQQHETTLHTSGGTLGGQKPRPWRIRVIWLLALAAATAAIIFFMKPDNNAQTQLRPFGPHRGMLASMPVAAASVTRADIPVTIQALGTVTPLATVTARTRVPGQLTRIAFSEGQQINKDTLLAVVDPRPYELALEQAKAQLAHDEAQLSSARIDLERYQALAKQNAIARQQLDTQMATVRQLEASVTASAAAMRTAELNLEYTSTTAPISGRAGLRQIDEGNYAQTGDSNGLVTITQMKPISVLFSVPEDQVPAINRRLISGETLPVTLYDRNRINKIAEGHLETIDNLIDTSTGTIRLRAVFDNDDEALFPNQFVNVELLVDAIKDAIIIPASARLTGSPGTYAWLIDSESKTVSVRPIKTGFSTADSVSVEEGLQPGDLVVTDGSDRLREGMRVTLPGASASQLDAQAAPEEAHQRRAPGRGPS